MTSTPAGDAIYSHVAHLAANATSDTILRAICQAAGALLQPARSVALGSDDLRPGQALWDASKAEIWALKWTALLSGATVTPRRSGESEASYLARVRDEVIHVRGWRRATHTAIATAAKQRLTGTRSVRIVERALGDQWTAVVITSPGETPDPGLLVADLVDPEVAIAGVQLLLRMSDEPLVDEMNRNVDDIVAKVDELTLDDVL